MKQFPDPVDLKVLDLLQEEFPLIPSPWDALGGRLGLPGSEVLSRVRDLQSRGIIRSISPILETGKIGLRYSTLVAMQVPACDIPRVVTIINEYPQVSHNYQREHDYNVWFTLSTRDEDECVRLVGEIIAKTGLPDEKVLNLVTLDRYKVDVRFRFDGDEQHG
ncbi:DNA-binding Lrp family transcriptional regulator [Methanolinea mesophila]|uniref:Lrp/AsnC family transcriptional regulator n=1 Tax=Methanolinea mesophila TaxID=547055 RepID=UPI001AE655FA|nr:Lrp/AsnC family transcriptional regulator [Methanolinea mesophila]MBP1927918.1 DNA-binding Lrp family transcriptional regulator [Methanolinea mesophila]